MNSIFVQTRRWIFCLVIVPGIAGSTAVCVGAETDEASSNQVPAEQVGTEQVDTEQVGTELRFSFNGTPWREVIGWVANQSGLALHVGDLPPGSFTYSDSSTYDVAAAIDRINLFLLAEGYTLVRSGELLSVINLSDKRSLQQLDLLAKQVSVDCARVHPQRS